MNNVKDNVQGIGSAEAGDQIFKTVLEYRQLWTRAADESEQNHLGAFFILDWPTTPGISSQQVIELKEAKEQVFQKYLIGRNAQCDITIPEESISNRHAVVLKRGSEDGIHWVLIDLKSTNGTAVGRQVLNPLVPHKLEDKQVIHLGFRVKMRYLSFKSFKTLLSSLSTQSKMASASTHTVNRQELETFIAEREDMVHAGATRLPVDRPLKRNEVFSEGEPASLAGFLKQAAEDERLIDSDLPADQGVSYWLRCDGYEPIELLETEPILIGRSSDADLVINDHLVSRRHAVVTIDDRAITVEDLGSSNGTIIDQHRIHKQKLVVLPGQAFHIGTAKLRVMERTPIEQEDSTTGVFEAVTESKEENPAAKVSFAGSVNGMPIMEVLQGIEFNSKTGTLFVEYGESRGHMVFGDGQPIYSEFERGSLSLRGLEAVYRLLALSDGRFAFLGDAVFPEQNLEGTTSRLVMDFIQMKDERSE